MMDGDMINMAAFVGPAVVGRSVHRSGGAQRQPRILTLNDRGRRRSRSGMVAMAKASKRSKGLSTDSEENAVDVFGGAGLDQEALLAAALAEPEKKPKKVSKKNASKAKEVSNDAVDGGNSIGGADKQEQAVINGEEFDGDGVLANKSSPNDSEGSSAKSRGKAKDKKKRLVVEDDSNAVDVFASLDGNAEASVLPSDGLEHLDLESETRFDVKPAAHGDVEELSGKVSDLNIGNPSKRNEEDDLSFAKSATAHETHFQKSQNVSENAPPETNAKPEEEDFQPDLDVVSEFDIFSENVSEFTLAGRRKTARETRVQRSAEEGRLGDPKRALYGSGGEKFSSVRLEDVTVVFRDTAVLNGVTWSVKTGDRVGLVGQNGCGKTTQLKLIAGLLEPTSGEVVRSSARTKFSFLRQEFVDELDPTRTLREEFLSAFYEERKALSEYERVEREIEEASEDLDKLSDLLNSLETARAKCDAVDAWNLDARIDKVMPGLGFVSDDNDKLVASFSGGWKVRIGIGKILLQDPDMLLLDEPSNHLDMQSVEWLEEYLQNCTLPMVIVSHDREFLNRVCNKIVDVEGGEAFEYPGNYSNFVKLKAERRKAWEAAYERQAKFISEQQQYIKQNRFSAARSKQVKSREKMLQRLERTGKLVRRPPRGGKPLVFRFPPAPRSGQDVVLIEDVTHGYDDKILFRDANIAVERGDRIAIVGPNGSGKSTLLRLITGQETPQSGKVMCKELYNVKLTYFEQNQADALDLDKSVLDTMKEAAPSDMTYEETRALLGKFLFKGDAVEKLVAALSGGEKARLALAKMMLEPANLMVLDEPTNHIDAGAMDMLEEALQHYDGTLIVVSHDRYFVSQVATQILFVEDQEIGLHEGDYKSFMEKNKPMKAVAEARFVDGLDGIKSAPEIAVEETSYDSQKTNKRKKKYGGSGVTSGRKKEMNAKRWKK